MVKLVTGNYSYIRYKFFLLYLIERNVVVGNEPYLRISYGENEPYLRISYGENALYSYTYSHLQYTESPQTQWIT